MELGKLRKVDGCSNLCKNVVFCCLQNLARGVMPGEVM